MESFFDTKHLYRSYFKMALPVVLGLAVTLVYNLADTFFIAQTNDTNLIAGVSLCAPVFTTLMAFGNIYGQGGSSLISRMLGQNNLDGTARISAFSFYIAIATGAVLAVVMTLFRSPLLTLLGASAETLDYAQSYYTVLTLCAPIIVLSFIHSNLVRCEGLANESMIGTILGAVVNIILDPILISGLGMGALGAAVATVIGYLCSVMYFLLVLRKKSHCLSVKLSQCHVRADELRQILGVGITAALSNLMQSLTVIVINQFLLAYGNDKIAAMGIVLKVTGADGVPVSGRHAADAALRAGQCAGRHRCRNAALAGCHRCVCRHRSAADRAVPGHRQNRPGISAVNQPAGHRIHRYACGLRPAVCL